MDKGKTSRIVGLDKLKTDKELSGIIVKICDLISDEDLAITKKIRELQSQPDSLEKLALMTECKIKAMQVDKIRRSVREIINASSNRLILAGMKPGAN